MTGITVQGAPARGTPVTAKKWRFLITSAVIVTEGTQLQAAVAELFLYDRDGNDLMLQTPGVAFCSSFDTFDHPTDSTPHWYHNPEKAFDRIMDGNASSWVSSSEPLPQHIGYEFSQPVTVYGYGVMGGTDIDDFYWKAIPTDWQLQYWDDIKLGWSDYDAQTGKPLLDNILYNYPTGVDPNAKIYQFGVETMRANGIPKSISVQQFGIEVLRYNGEPPGGTVVHEYSDSVTEVAQAQDDVSVARGKRPTSPRNTATFPETSRRLVYYSNARKQ